MSKRIHTLALYLGATLGLAASATLALGASHVPPPPPPGPMPVQCKPDVRTVTNPPVFNLNALRPAPNGALRALSAAEIAAPGEKELDLHVVYTIGHIYNPSTGRCDQVSLRSYANTANGSAGEYVAPTIPITPGDTIHINLHNDLPDDPTCLGVTDANMDHPHCFNGTNLHSHGLWISPTGNSDNVLLNIAPKQSFEYIYNVPPDHPAGTFWYHTHLHGSTALQVSSGMAGAIIIRGNRLPTPIKNGDIDTLLKGVPEEVLVMQQIQYACLTKDYTIQLQTAPAPTPGDPTATKVVAWPCNPDQVGIVGPYIGTDGQLGYSDKNGNGYGPGNWADSDRYTSVNGVVLPTFKATAGQMARWRMIHAGVRDTISLQFYHMKPGVKLSAIAPQADQSFIDQNCVGAPIPFHAIAQDGLTTAVAQPMALATFQPGYRVDALVMFPEAGNYCVIDASSNASSNVSRKAEPGRLIGAVIATGPAKVADITKELTKQLLAAAQKYMPADIRTQVEADLSKGLLLTHFVPHPTVTDAEIAGTPNEELYFNIDVSTPNTKFEVGNSPTTLKPYEMDRIDRTLVLGKAQEWDLRSLFVSHPFHIHVNPFQIVAIYDPNGKDVSAPGAVDDFALTPDNKPTTGKPDPEYPGLKGVWKDTIWVKNAGTTVAGMYHIVIRTRYQRYIGEFVLHCHILDHEDQGMMQNVEIVPPSYSIPGQASTAPAPMAPMSGMTH
ncbi:MAG TPA: multicopper oxidase domain-containing protein [Rhizomicrobium sp.]|jgi:FtsP/CotA-like multicopper oxidase with cupredoxin domain|nr:multicopper oxidase domain-containing protein [Rhizomicrobium sp.]